MPPSSPCASDRLRYIDPVRTILGAERFESARAEGRTMALGDAITLARQQALC
jgi:hypothetical protein